MPMFWVVFGISTRKTTIPRSDFHPRRARAATARRFPPATNRTNLRSTVEVGVWRIPLEVQRKAMGIDWMTTKELSQAIPPAYSEFIARAMEPA